VGDDEVELDALALLEEAGVELLVEIEVVGFVEVESDVEMMLDVVVSVEPSTLVVSEPVVDDSDDKEGMLGRTISHEASNKVNNEI
jgi:hypothetical protein